MFFQSLTRFGPTNRRLLLALVIGHLTWGALVVALWAVAGFFDTAPPWLALFFLLLQLFAATQLLLPALLLQPEVRTRGFYLFWIAVLALLIWLLNGFNPANYWEPVIAALRSSLLLLAATLVGAVLARYVNRMWEILPLCIVMTLADFTSWLYGPTAEFAKQIQGYYLAPDGAPPLIDMALVKLAFPANSNLMPVFGVSDWIMVAFFAVISQRFAINDNILGPGGDKLAHAGRVGRYLPLSVAALCAAVLIAQLTGFFLPALPLIALIMFLWYSSRTLLHYYRCRGK